MKFFNKICSHATAIIILSPWYVKLIAVLTAALTFLFGKVELGAILGTLIIVDTVTGWIKARNEGNNPSSKVLWQKLQLKIWGYLIPLFVVAVLGLSTYYCFGENALNIYAYLQFSLIWLYSIREGTSILENLTGALGIKVPFITLLIKFLKGKQKSVEEQLESLCGDKEV